jgi:PhzF family phenazine biosynthesis protein
VVKCFDAGKKIVAMAAMSSLDIRHLSYRTRFSSVCHYTAQAEERFTITTPTKCPRHRRNELASIQKMAIPIYHVDAFATKPFEGNPTAVCLLEEEEAAAWMQLLAAEMNLSETAFVRPAADGFELRWFTPTVEVELCGHATLASAHVLWTSGAVRNNEPIRFHTKSGVLTCDQCGNLIELDFPATPAVEAQPPAGLLDALGIRPLFIGRSPFDKFVVVESEEVVRSLRPDFHRLRTISGMRGVIVTSTSRDPQFDFISRYFAPGAGIDEDPVTGSAHCCLAPYWCQRLGKNELTGYQASSRGGVVRVRVAGNRIILGGSAVTVCRGEVILP